MLAFSPRPPILTRTRNIRWDSFLLCPSSRNKVCNHQGSKLHSSTNSSKKLIITTTITCRNLSSSPSSSSSDRLSAAAEELIKAALNDSTMSPGDLAKSSQNIIDAMASFKESTDAKINTVNQNMEESKKMQTELLHAIEKQRKIQSLEWALSNVDKVTNFTYNGNHDVLASQSSPDSSLELRTYLANLENEIKRAGGRILRCELGQLAKKPNGLPTMTLSKFLMSYPERFQLEWKKDKSNCYVFFSSSARKNNLAVGRLKKKKDGGSFGSPIQNSQFLSGAEKTYLTKLGDEIKRAPGKRILANQLAQIVQKPNDLPKTKLTKFLRNHPKRFKLEWTNNNTTVYVSLSSSLSTGKEDTLRPLLGQSNTNKKKTNTLGYPSSMIDSQFSSVAEQTYVRELEDEIKRAPGGRIHASQLAEIVRKPDSLEKKKITEFLRSHPERFKLERGKDNTTIYVSLSRPTKRLVVAPPQNQKKSKQQQQQQQKSRNTEPELLLSLEEKALYVAMDCEMVGVLGRNGEISSVARVILIGWDGNVIMDEFVKQVQQVTCYRTPVSGIKRKDLKNAKLSLVECRKKVKKIINGKVLIGHSLKDHDMKALEISHPWYMIRDTATYKPFMLQAGKSDHGPRKLKDLVKEKLKRDIQVEGKPHDAYEDALAALDLYRFARYKWEQEMANKIMKMKKRKK